MAPAEANPSAVRASLSVITAAPGHAQDVAQMVAGRLSGARADRDGDSRLQPRVPSSADQRIGSSIAETTRTTPAAMTASAQGGEAPKCEQGSSVT